MFWKSRQSGMTERRKKGRRRINMTQQEKNEMIIEKTERMTEDNIQKAEKKDRFLPIFFWTD